ncbi:MAG: NADH-quinone oxidoreductase subunit NuoE [Acidiferrobacterales bacterium]
MSSQSQAVSRTALIDADSQAKIDRWLVKYPPERKQAAVMGTLLVVQEQNGGWLTTELMDAVAEYLEIPPIAVYEVATFYTLYDLEPVGRHKIYVCTNIACMLCGSQAIVEHLEKKLGIKLGETTPDDRITLKEAECLAACGGAPMFMVDGAYHENLTLAMVDEILDNLE